MNSQWKMQLVNIYSLSDQMNDQLLTLLNFLEADDC